MGLIDALGKGPDALDTVVFIYFIAEHPEFLPLVAPVFDETARGKREIVTSAVTLLEVLVVPYRAGNQPLAERYEALLTGSRGVHLLDIDRLQLRAAAQIRARYAVRTPGALQLAAALTRHCTAFITNDRALREIPGLAILRLDSFRQTAGGQTGPHYRRPPSVVYGTMPGSLHTAQRAIRCTGQRS